MSDSDNGYYINGMVFAQPLEATKFHKCMRAAVVVVGSEVPMLVRFGYVALSLVLKNASPNGTVTVKNLERLPEDVHRLKLQQLAQRNLHNQLRLLRHNLAHDIRVYRFTSHLIPLASHPKAADWNYAAEFADEFGVIGDLVKAHDFRVGFHPDHFVNLNSPDEHIFSTSLNLLHHHILQSEAMGLDERVKFNIHVGGKYGDVRRSRQRFIDNWARVPEALRQRLTLENDDKVFSVADTLFCCETLGIPMVLDVHHYLCHPALDDNSESPKSAFADAAADHDPPTGPFEALADWLPRIFKTWDGTGLPPKIHLSSPRGLERPADWRSHADYVDPERAVSFLTVAKDCGPALDVMIEAKQKDVALSKLMDSLATTDGIVRVDGASIRL